MEGMPVEPGALVPGWDIREAVGRFDREFLENLHARRLGVGADLHRGRPVGHEDSPRDAGAGCLPFDFAGHRTIGNAEGPFDLLLDGQGLIKVDAVAEDLPGSTVP